jgi:membrane-bound lytic murein transglycosylase D
VNSLVAEVDASIDAEDREYQESDIREAAGSDIANNGDTQVGDEKVMSGESPSATPLKHGDRLSIPMELNSKVDEWISYFRDRDHERFQRFLSRGEKYRTNVVAMLKDMGVPTELYYLAMIESGYVTGAKSHASALGVWQFVAATGKRYGLQRNSYVDERLDPMRATIAAAAYLKDLNTVFQSWYLAMAAYNAGEGRILSSIMKANTRDFWELVKKRALPKETMDYVPKFLAAAIIGRNPEKFGFNLEAEERLPAIAQVSVPGSLTLKAVADASGVSYADLRDLNPHLHRGMTPPGSNDYDLWVPAASVESVLDARGGLQTKVTRGLKARPSNVTEVADEPSPQFHKVRRGETIGKIARRYGITPSLIRSMNGLASNRLSVGAKIRVAGTGNIVAENLSQLRYKVKRGDSLRKIASHFGMSVTELRRVNRIRRNSGLRVGQVLRVVTANQT